MSGEIISSQASSSSSSSSSSRHRGWNYDAFLSFRGEDTRRTFTDHLYLALKGAGINVFRDDNELRIGQNISRELIEAIKSSKISIIVFSEDYAASSWCLDELVIIMECKISIQQVIFPVFYHVDPSDVRKQRGSYAEAFVKHEGRFAAEIEKVLGWRHALTDAANLKGFHCTLHSHEGELIKEIVKEVLSHVNDSYLNEAMHPVGLESRVQKVNSLLSIGSNDVRIIGICAMGGMGKTTIAKAVYNHLFRWFDHKCFLADVRESSKQPVDQVHLQEKLLCDLLNREDIKVGNVDRGINVIRERLFNKRVLIVLDDVDKSEQLSTLAITMHDWLGLGSRIIITTRDTHLLEEIHLDYYAYMVEELNYDESVELFSWHAFRSIHPKEDFVKLSKDVIGYCKGLPLALKVLGSSLFGRDESYWKGAIDKLKRIPHNQIQEKLKISYDSLEDDTEKAIFLDVACFFIGMDKDYVATILDGCGFFADVGISVLISRCLLTNKYNKLMMHDLVRDMGRGIVRESSLRYENHTRLWFHDEVLDVVKNNKGTKAVEGIVLKLPILNKKPMSTEAFAKMHNLRLLQLDEVHLTGSYDHFSKELRWVRWHGFPLKLIPSNFHLENLVILDMQYSNLRKFSKEIKVLGKLKVLNLSHSEYLIKTPNFSQLTNLEKLELEYCISLIAVHPSIGHLHRLVLLNMKNCKQLKNLPRTICMLKSLEILNLSGCSKFEKLPEDLGELKALIQVHADGTAIRQVPTSIVCLKNIKNLSLGGCLETTSSSLALVTSSWISIRKSPQRITLLPDSLLSLRLSHCNLVDQTIPNDFTSLSSLQNLNLAGNKFRSLPASISNLPKLEKLNLDDCTELESVPELPIRLRYLVAGHCVSLKILPDMSRFQAIPRLFLVGCQKLVEIPGLEKLNYSGSVHLEGCHNLASTVKETLLLAHPTYPLAPDSRGMFLSGISEIPKQFQHQGMGGLVSFQVSPTLEPKPTGIQVCVVYGSNDNNGSDGMWAGHIGYFLLRGGDRVEVELVDIDLIFGRPSVGPYVNAKKCGVCLYDQFEGSSQSNSIMHNSNSNERLLYSSIIFPYSDSDIRPFVVKIRVTSPWPESGSFASESTCRLTMDIADDLGRWD